MEIDELKKHAKDLRKDILAMLSAGGHFGGAYSCVEILVALHMDVLTEEDKFILSKAHSSVALYAILAKKGLIDKTTLATYGKKDSALGVHAERHLIPGVEFSCGSLGHGLAYGGGLALANKLKNKSGKLFVLLGDGECEEGSVWEAAMFAAHHALDNLIAIVDYNKKQASGRVENIVCLEPFVDKLKSFGWEVIEVDGHNFENLMRSFAEARNSKGKPIAIIAHTVKGKGVSAVENKANCHFCRLSADELLAAREELET